MKKFLLLLMLPCIGISQNIVLSDSDTSVGNPNLTDGIYCTASTTWNGSEWSNGTPTEEMNAIIAGNYAHSGGAFTSCSIYVTGNAQVVFKNNSNAIVIHNVNVAATASLVFESGSNLIQIEDTQNAGNVTIQRFGSKLQKLDYTFWSSPVTGSQTLMEFSPATLQNRFYIYYTETNDYFSIPSPSTTTFETAKAYLIRMPNQITGPQAAAYNAGGYRFAFEGLFTGVPNNGNIYFPLVHTSEMNSYNGVGNPYPSPISITDFIDANIDNIEGTIWVWRKTNNPNETSYCTITKLGYIANNAPGGGGTAGDGGNDLIADPFEIDDEGVFNTGQGFIVKAKNSQNLVFRNDMRKSNNYQNFFRNADTQDTPPPSNAVAVSRIWLNISNGSGAFSQTMVGYTPEATLGYDNGIDGKGLVDATACLYSVVEDTRLAIQGRPSFSEDDVVPLGFKTQIAGQFTMGLERVNGIFSGEQKIFIKDKLTGVDYDIKNGSFTFTSEVGTFEDRFEIFYAKPEALGTTPPIVGEALTIINNGSGVKVSAPEEIKAITIYDVTGKLVYRQDNINASTFVSPDIIASKQVIIVNVTQGNDVVVSKKIMMK